MIATTWRRTTTARWWGRRSARGDHDRPVEVLAVLQHARAIVEAGWVQNRWTVERPHLLSPAGSAAVAGTPVGTTSACLVGAVALAVRARDPRADLAVDTGPALAFVWDAVHDGGRAAGRSAPREVRLARMRELARWNDERGRTRDDVVAVLDRAAARVVAGVVDPGAEASRV